MERPNYDAALPEGVDAASVLNDYLEAIGGRAKAESIRSKRELASGSMQGMSLEIESKKTNQKQSSVAVKMMGNTMQKVVVNKDKGYTEAQGQHIPMGEEQLSAALAETAIFAELALDPANVSLAGVVDVDGTKAYELKISASKSFFYAVDSHLKIKVSETQEMQGNTITQETLIGDYKEIDGLLFPHKITQSFGPQKIDFITSNIELNVDFADEDFQ